MPFILPSFSLYALMYFLSQSVQRFEPIVVKRVLQSKNDVTPFDRSLWRILNVTIDHSTLRLPKLRNVCADSTTCSPRLNAPEYQRPRCGWFLIIPAIPSDSARPSVCLSIVWFILDYRAENRVAGDSLVAWKAADVLELADRRRAAAAAAAYWSSAREPQCEGHASPLNQEPERRPRPNPNAAST